MSEAGATVIEDDKSRRDAQEVIRVPAPEVTDHDSAARGAGLVA